MVDMAGSARRSNRGLRCVDTHSLPQILRGVKFSGMHAPVWHEGSWRHSARARALVSVKLSPEQIKEIFVMLRRYGAIE
jgi:hypothetical protein